jgi:hypothetical protein
LRQLYRDRVSQQHLSIPKSEVGLAYI